MRLGGRSVKRTAIGLLVLLVGAGVAGNDDDNDPAATLGSPVAASASASPSTVVRFESSVEMAPPVETASATPAATPAAEPAAAPLTFAAAGGDGDSWKDRSGREIRLGLVNAPETGECFGPEATAKREALVRGGFRATAYATDRYGRSVSSVSLPDGRNLNVLLAQQGFVDDRYLDEFRHENPALAGQLDKAFAEAKAAERGLWGGCSADSAPQAFAAPPPAKPAAGCHPDYATCIPVKGDGSGAGAANDLDCGDIRKLVRIRQIGVDPYRLDGSDGDGLGCESYA